MGGLADTTINLHFRSKLPVCLALFPVFSHWRARAQHAAWMQTNMVYFVFQ